MNRVNASRSLRNWLILALSRIPGRYGVGIFPWLVVLLFSAGAASVPTAGPYESQWVRAAIIISISAWLVQGLALLAVRPWARRLPPTIGGGLITLATFAVLGGIGGAVGVIGYQFVDLPDRPGFFQPIPIMIMATTTWVCVGAIIAISFSFQNTSCVCTCQSATAAKTTATPIRSHGRTRVSGGIGSSVPVSAANSPSGRVKATTAYVVASVSAVQARLAAAKITYAPIAQPT